MTVLVVDTTAPRTLAGSAYNQRRRECEEGAPGVYGARMTGAGFGGCAIALVYNDAAPALAARVAAEYPRRTGRIPNIYPCVASDGTGWAPL